MLRTNVVEKKNIFYVQYVFPRLTISEISKQRKIGGK
jgi:hypothetical protein